MSKTVPSIEAARTKAISTAVSLVNNFLAEVEVYGNFSEIIMSEEMITEWVTVYGVDIPLPLHAVVDRVVITEDGKTVIIDDKSVAKFSTEQDRAMAGGKQAITYVLAVEKRLGVKVDEVWFVENKPSKNKDGSPQLKLIKIEIDNDTRRLYEAMLYASIKRMIEAVSDPDHIYIINDSDSFESAAEMYEFWMRTLITEVDDFNIDEDKKELLKKRQKKTKDSSLATINPKVISEFRKNAAAFIAMDYNKLNMTNSEKIEHVLRHFGVVVEVAHAVSGYSSDTYLLRPSAGLKISPIFRYRLDIAAALNVSNVGISPILVVYDGSSYVRIDVTKKRDKDCDFDSALGGGAIIPIGRDNMDNVIEWDLNCHSTPHMLICGATGSGKSVSIISSIEYALLGDVEEIIILDLLFKQHRYI